MTSILYKPLYKASDFERLLEEPIDQEEKRTPFRQDCERLIHSPAFRRLQHKMQLFPALETDFFRSRLTHSIEVAQIAITIANKINKEHKYFQEYPINLDLIEFSGLAHDLGHPPFGHNGERALDSIMKLYGGFESNAQTLRMLSVLEKKHKSDDDINNIGINSKGKDLRFGLNLTYRSLASILKYDKIINFKRKAKDELFKGYYESNKDLVKLIKTKVVDDSDCDPFKTIECHIMDIADDIAYCTYDLEDTLKANFINPLDFISLDEEVLNNVYNKIKTRDDVSNLVKDQNQILDILFFLIKPTIDPDIYLKSSDELINKDGYFNALSDSYAFSKRLMNDGYIRSRFCSTLIHEFINSITVELNEKCPPLTKVSLEPEAIIKLEVLKYFLFYSITNSSRVRIAEYRGNDIIKKIFNSINSLDEDGYLLLPDDFKLVYHTIDDKYKERVICDYIAGMTDNYALEFYGRLYSENPQTLFKPI